MRFTYYQKAFYQKAFYQKATDQSPTHSYFPVLVRHREQTAARQRDDARQPRAHFGAALRAQPQGRDRDGHLISLTSRIALLFFHRSVIQRKHRHLLPGDDERVRASQRHPADAVAEPPERR